MNINHDNYEEYFILYMDNELGNDERRQVEEFVQKHPDLKEELDLLLQYKMAPDTSIVFNKKEELMMHEDASALTLDNYEKWLVLYMDNELTAEQKIAVEQFIAIHPSVKTELALLQRTQLQPEKIIFTDKELLYKRTTERPVITFRWWQVAAAVLILAIGITAVVLLNKKASTNKDIAIIPEVEQKAIKENPVVNNNDENKKEAQLVIANTAQSINSSALKQINGNVAAKHNTAINKKLPAIFPLEQKEQPVIVNITNSSEKPSNNLPKPLNNPNVNNNITKNDIARVDPNEMQNPQESIANRVTTISTQPSQVVYNPSAKDDELNQSGGKKSKLRGFFRKVARTFEKTTKINPADDENRVLVGGLAFKLN